MSSDQNTTQLSDYLLFRNGKSSPERKDGDAIPVFGANGIIGHSSEQNAGAETIVIGRVGSYCGSVHFSKDACWVSDNAIICASKNNSDSLFWYYFLLNADLNQFRSGSGQPLINQGTLNSIPCNVPSKLSDRVSIGEILSSFDDKIKLNHQINQTLEQMAQAIFQSWFVDFEPVKAKIAAREDWLTRRHAQENQQGQQQEAQPQQNAQQATASADDTPQVSSPACYAHEFAAAASAMADQPDLITAMNRAAMCAISGKTDADLDAMPAADYQRLYHTASLFPDELAESELGAIPKGWEVVRLDSLLELAYGKALKATDRTPGGFNVYGSGGITGTHNEALVAGPGIIVGRKGTVGSLNWEDSAFYPIDTVYYVKPHRSEDMSYIFYLLKTLSLDKMNTDAAVPGLNRNNVYRLPFTNPGFTLISLFSDLIDIFRKNISSLSKQTESLIGMRDSLLPKLLSGELDISALTDLAAVTDAATGAAHV